MDMNIDALYNILKQNQGDVNDVVCIKKKVVVVTSDLLVLVAKKTKVSKALLAKAFHQKKYYAKPTNNNLRTSSASTSANKKPEYVKSEDKKEDGKKRDMSKVKCYNCKREGHFSIDYKKANVKDYGYYKTKMLLVKKDIDEQVLLVGNLVQLWESNHTWKWVWRLLIIFTLIWDTQQPTIKEYYFMIINDAAAMKHMASNFAKLDKFKGMDFRRWQKKMHFLLSSMSVVYVLTTLIPEDGGDDATVEEIRKMAKMLNLPKNYEIPWRPNIWLRMHQVRSSLFTQHKINMDEAIQVFCIIDKLPPFWKYFKHTLKHLKEKLTLVELGSHLRIEGSLRMQDSDKPKGNNVVGPSLVNMVEHNNSSRYNDKKGATIHMCKDRCWFKTYESLNDGSILHMGNESTALVHGRGCVDLKFSSGKIVSLFNVLHVPNIRKNLVSSSVLNNCGYKQVIESNKFVLSKHGVFIGFGYLSNQMFRLNIVNDNIASAFMSTSKLNDSILWHARLGHVHFKRMQDMSKDGLIPAFDMDTEKCKTCMLNKITKKPFQNVKRETEVLKLIHSDLCDRYATPSLGNKNTL
ncbi:zinc finger, CCHC-type containing protein [Tanacetum coccineum]